MRLLAPAAALLLALLGACGGAREFITVKIGGESYRIEVARTEEQKARGLMHRRSLGEREGMIFVHQADERLSFWMKDTVIPLDLVFLSRDGEILEVVELKPLSLKPVSSLRAARYALELPRGTMEKLGVKAGDRVELPAGFP